jgi:hypothetical protein
MGHLPVLALRIVLAIALVSCVIVQTVMVPLLATDLEQDFDADVASVRVPIIIVVVLGVGVVEVCAVCVWRLLTMVRTGTVFSPGAFRFVDTIIGAIAFAALLAFGLGAVLAPGESVAPGVVLLVGGVGVVVAGIALIVLVMRTLLTQAVARDAEAEQLQTELDEVI